MKKEVVVLDGKKGEVCYELLDGRLWLHVGGQTYDFESSRRKSSRSGSGSKSEPGVLRAQMPGKILKIHVEEGQVLKTGEPVVAMEAMKMEYVLKADMDGVVAAISCSVEEQVGLGTVLVRLEGE